MYSSTHQFEPLVPAAIPPSILEKAAQIEQLSLKITGVAHKSTRETIRELVRDMSVYYSNQIEGLHAQPSAIEDAKHSRFSDSEEIAKRQRMALAHIEAERELVQRVVVGDTPMSSDFLMRVHAALYSRLPESDRIQEDGRCINPGELRQHAVIIGRHIPPDAASLPQFNRRLDEVFCITQRGGMQLIHTACLHHRATWVHPFKDGNGRTIRLQTNCALFPLSDGLWTPTRGFALNKEDYYSQLSNADAHRRGDLDGRGNLSTKGLLEWVEYFLEICSGQVTGMATMMDLENIRRRIEEFIKARSSQDKAIRQEVILPLYHLFAAGPLLRHEFVQITSLGERTGRALTSKLLKEGLLVSDTAYGPVRLGLPLTSLPFLFPALYVKE